jgi:uncharacterized protein (TIGR03663 family)
MSAERWKLPQFTTIGGTRTDGRRPAGAALPIDRLLSLRLRVTWDTALIGALFIVAFVLRFYDLGSRAIHHDESLHATFSWYFYRGQGYEHDPLMHGPFLFHAMALTFGLFGLTDATARFVPAILGALLVLLPLLLRDRLGRAGTIAACALLTISPTLLYFSRFVGAGAQDIVLAVTALLIVAGIWRYLADGRSHWLYLIAGSLSLSFATKEVTFIIALIFILWLNGLTAAMFASRRAASPRRRIVWSAAIFPIAWLIVMLWPALKPLHARLRFEGLPRAADLLLVLGLFTAPQFAAAVQVPLHAIGIEMDDPSPIAGVSNEALVGGATVGLLLMATTLAGLAWRRREFLICAAVFWSIYVLLFTSFMTNLHGFATGIWGSLDYWIEQHGEERGRQPVFYYAVITPVYEYLALILATWGIVRAAVRGGRWTALSLVFGLLFVLIGVIAGEGSVRGAPFALLAMLALVLALRRDLFRSFLAFWAAAVFFGLSVAGEKMPWLEVHIALPLALLAALTVNDLVTAVRTRSGAGVNDGRGAPSLRTVGTITALAAAAGMAAAAILLWPGGGGGRAPAVLLALGAALLLGIGTSVRSRAAGGLVIGGALIGLLLPLTARDAVRAAFVYADTPHELLIYTQTSPRLKQIADQIDELARVSGAGTRLPITIDTSQAFTWPWAWYLRDYTDVLYIDLANYPATELPKLRQPAVLVTFSNNVAAAQAWPDAFGPGERFPHRWWFPEETYRVASGPRIWRWIRDPERWSAWLDFLLHRTVPYPIGSVDAVAFFPPEFVPSGPHSVPSTLAPRREGERLLVGGSGSQPGAFVRPAGLAIDANGQVFVADTLNDRVQKFSPDGERLAISPRSLGLWEPWGVAADAAGNVYVADTSNHRIVKLDNDLRLIRAWGGPPTSQGRAEPGPSDLYAPRGIAIDLDGNVWVSDTGHSRVIVFSGDGTPLGAIGGPGRGPGQFLNPVGIARAAGGDMLVADATNGRVQRFNRNRDYIGEIQVAGWDGDAPENQPYLVELSDGSVLVSVPSAGRIERIGADGRGRTSWERFGPGERAVRPLGVAVDSRGRIWATDALGSTLIRLPAP